MGEMVETRKILSDRYHGACCDGTFKLRDDSGTRGHSEKTDKQRPRLNLRKYSFLCSVDNWYHLQDYVNSFENINIFERKLNEFEKTKS